MGPIPFLRAKRLIGKMELALSHQSSFDLTICLKILQSTEESAIGRMEVFEFGFGIKIIV